jgi:hypothetical protein
MIACMYGRTEELDCTFYVGRRKLIHNHACHLVSPWFQDHIVNHNGCFIFARIALDLICASARDFANYEWRQGYNCVVYLSNVT